MALARGSVIVTVVLLKVALTWATPSASTTFFAFFPVAIRLLGYLLLAGDRAARPLLRARVGVRPLTAHRQPATVADATVRSDVHESLDVHRDFGAQRTLDPVFLLDDAAQLLHVGVREVADAQRRVDPRLLQDLHGRGPSDPENVGQSDLDLLVLREIDARNTRHSSISPDAAYALDCACR